jgi:hypothetical protein
VGSCYQKHIVKPVRRGVMGWSNPNGGPDNPTDTAAGFLYNVVAFLMC